MKFTVSYKNGFALTSMGLMLLSAVLLLYYNLGKPLSTGEFWSRLVLPIASALLYLLALPLWGRKTMKPLCLPVLGGVAFFALKSLGFTSVLHTVLCCLLYLAVLLLCCLTFWGVIRTKYLPYPLFGLPLLAHIAMDIDELWISKTLPSSEFPPEAAVLCMMAGLLSLALGMKKEPA